MPKLTTKANRAFMALLRKHRTVGVYRSVPTAACGQPTASFLHGISQRSNSDCAPVRQIVRDHRVLIVRVKFRAAGHRCAKIPWKNYGWLGEAIKEHQSRGHFLTVSLSHCGCGAVPRAVVRTNIWSSAQRKVHLPVSPEAFRVRQRRCSKNSFFSTALIPF